MFNHLKPRIAGAVKKCVLNLHIDQFAANLSCGNYLIMVHMVPKADAGDFEAVLRFLDQRYKLVSLDELVERLTATGGKKAAGYSSITFDDGFRNHYTVAYPVLQRLSIPATFYVCSGLLDSEAYVWTWEIGLRLEQLTIPDRQSLFQRSDVADTSYLVNWLKTQPLLNREKLQADIIALTPAFHFS